MIGSGVRPSGRALAATRTRTRGGTRGRRRVLRSRPRCDSAVGGAGMLALRRTGRARGWGRRRLRSRRSSSVAVFRRGGGQRGIDEGTRGAGVEAGDRGPRLPGEQLPHRGRTGGRAEPDQLPRGSRWLPGRRGFGDLR